MTVRVNFLAPGPEASELRVLLRQLALLWKFELKELAADGSGAPPEANSLLMVDLCSAPADYQEAVARQVQAGPGRSLLFATQNVSLQPALKELSGVSAVAWQGYDIDLKVRILSDDPLLHSLGGSLRLLRFSDGAAGAIETAGAAVLLRADNGMSLLARRGTCYTVALPVWQFGIVSFPSWFRIMENALFFDRGLPHLAPGPYVAFRIDDLPVTGESSVKQGYSDARACAEIREIQAGHRLYGARLEYMLSSHAINAEGKLVKAPELGPKAFRLLGELYQRGEINVGAHGTAHLDLEEYRRTGRIVPQEFMVLDKTETRATLQALKQWLAEVFGKDRLGFVAPAWGYREGVTKPEAAGLFSYIADSNQHLQQSDGRELFGTMRNGCVSLFETWRSGMSGIRMANDAVFQAFLGSGLPIHLMLHGPFPRDSLTRRRKTSLLLFALITMVGGNIWLWYCCNQQVLMAWILLQIFMLGMAYGNRRNLGWRLRLAMPRLGFGESLRRLANAAHQVGAKFVFVEELADHMAEYNSLSVQSVTGKGKDLKMRLACSRRLSRIITIHFPGTVVRASIQPEIPFLSSTDNIVGLGSLEKGTYDLSASME